MTGSNNVEQRSPEAGKAGAGINPTELIPDLFAKFFEFFGPGHTEGVVPARIKELARLKIASINGCDT